jgi:hypothetical protein
MSTGLKDGAKVGRKKRERPARTVRMDADLISMADLLARKKGVPVGVYLSGLFRSAIEREYARLVEKSSRQIGPGGQEGGEK